MTRTGGLVILGLLSLHVCSSAVRAAAPLSNPSASARRINETLLQGRRVMEEGHPEQAIVKYFEPVIADYERRREGSKTRYFSATSQAEIIIYSALPAPAGDPGAVEVLDSNWGAAYLLKAYALTELHRVAEAQLALQAAIALSPMNSQYKSELAYTYQVQKDCERSIALYAQAAADAETASDESTKSTDLTRAWRGQGYCLVEEGKWDDAAALYRKCLALDPKDSKARGELQYVEENKPR